MTRNGDYSTKKEGCLRSDQKAREYGSFWNRKESDKIFPKLNPPYISQGKLLDFLNTKAFLVVVFI